MKKDYTLSNRLTALVVMMCFVFPLVSFGASADNGMPTDLTPVYVDDFSDGVIASNITTKNFYTEDPADTLVESDGKLTFTRSKWIWYTDKNYGEAAVKFSADSAGTPLTGKIFVEYTLSKTREVVRMRMCDSKDGYLTQVNWEGDTLRLMYADSELVSHNKELTVSSSESVKVSVYADFSSSRPVFSMWINDVKQLDNVNSCTALSGGDFGWMSIYTLVYGSYGKAGSFTLDNAGIYRVADDYVDEPVPEPDNRTDEQKVDDDLALISDDDVLSVPVTDDGYILDPLDIDGITVGDSGSAITWTSSRPDIISSDGKLTRPAADTDVTVTATAELGNVTKQKSFTYTVAGLSTDIDGMRTDIFPIYYDDFSDGEPDSRIETVNIKSTDKVYEQNGKFVLKTSAWASHEPGVRFYTNEKRSTLSGDFVMEFTLSKTCDVARLRTYNEQYNYLNQIYWSKDSFVIYYRDENKTSQTLTLDIPADQKAKVTIYTEVTGSSPKFTMWVNNSKVLEDVYSCVDMSPANVKWIQIYTVNTGNYGKTGNLNVDNFGYYDILPDMTDAERVQADYEALTDESLIKTFTPLSGYAFEDLNMPSYGKNGSKISWSSSDESIVQTNGKVTRADNENKPVTLMAVITSGSAKLTKTFEVIILGNHVETDDLPTVEKMITENSFDSSDTPNLIKTGTAGGGTVGISGGKLNISKTGQGTTAVSASIYTGANDTASATGIIGLEFDVEREKAQTVQIRSMDANGNLYYSMGWGSSGVSAYYSSDKSTAGTPGTVWLGSTNKIHINMMFDAANSTYWLWVNGEAAVVEKYSRSVGVGAICCTMFYLENINNITIDNYSIYEAIPPKALRLRFDTSSFGNDDILNEIPQVGNVIQSSLTLPAVLRYGTTVSWQSSDEELIDSSTGEVTRPTDVAENPPVTLTASFENSGITAEKEYSYYILRNFSAGTDVQYEELQDIKPSYLTNEDPTAIRTSLNLMEKGLYGSDIIWTSSNTSVITNSGRVVRPRFDEDNATVTMTARIGSYTKELTFTVVADEPPKDPMHTSDEEFFGVWNGTEFVKGPQLDYDNLELADVMEAAKAGNYATAKQALLEYFKTRNVPSPISFGTRHTGWVDARADGLFELSEEAVYWKGLISVTSDEYKAVTASIYLPSAITVSSCKTFELISRYNESTSAYVLGSDADNPNMVPELEITVNGAVRSYRATNTATIRAGSYSREHIDDNKVLQAKMFGDFLGDETYRILLAFDLSDIEADDVISDAQLTVYAKKSSASADSKQLWIIDNRNSAWSEDSVYWDSLNFVVHNYNGLVGGSDWKGARSSDVEFAYQMPRFAHTRNTLTEYKYTGNEKYAYSILSQVMDFISDCGGKTPYPRSLDAGLRMNQWVPLINAVKDSPYFTEEFITAFMKYMYAQFEYFPTRKEATGNWRDYEQLSVLYATSAYPELANSASTKETCIWSWGNAFNKSYMSDGAYIEDTGGYHRSSFAMYRDFKKACVDSNTTLPEEFDETLHKAAYYMVLTNGPKGLTLQYGDEGGGSSGSNRYSEVADWYSDYEFRYIDSFGSVGTEPSWTSYQFPEGRYTMMRSDWGNDAIYLHTNVRGGGGHGHADDNSIILMGNGKRLLVDAGKFTYNSYDATRLYGQSTQGHNTVVINDASQRTSWTGNEYTVRGDINNWVTNSEFDFLSQTSISYPDHDHNRSIFFIKDGLFVVSDLMEPHDFDSENNYKQYWHMLPEANISADDDNKTISSNYDDGKNLILASADDVSAQLEDGYYDIADGTPVANKAGIFEKTASGAATFDTVMYVTNYKDAEVTTERIDTGRPTSEATAIKITVSENNADEIYYYMYNHNPGGDEISFGDYSSDARVALVRESQKGDIVSMMMTDGSTLKKNGTPILAADGGTTDISAEFTSTGLNIVSSDEALSAGSVSAVQAKAVKSVVYNGNAKEFEVSDGIISVGSADTEEVVINDNNKNDGIGDRTSLGGNAGSTGGSGGSASIGGIGTGTDITVGNLLSFNDIEDHWAAGYITDLHSKSIVNGNPDGSFAPDRTISRAEFTAISIRAIGAEATDYCGEFADVASSDWFARELQTAVNLSIISKDTHFRPNDSITREEMSKILTQCAIYLGITETEKSELGFTDTGDISEWAAEYVRYAVSISLMNGKPDNLFDPLGNATRAETAAVFSRLIAKL